MELKRQLEASQADVEHLESVAQVRKPPRQATLSDWL